MNRMQRRMKPTVGAVSRALSAQDKATEDKVANVLQGYDDRLIAPIRVRVRLALGLAGVALLLAVVGVLV